MPNIYTITLGDESKEKTSVSFHLPLNIDPINVETYLGDTGLGYEQQLLDAIQALSLGTIMSTTGSIKVVREPDFPVDPNAQRERKLLVTYIDDVYGRKHSFEIGCYNLAGKLPGSDLIDTTSQEWLDLVAALANYTGADDGTITLLEGRMVGRNL